MIAVIPADRLLDEDCACWTVPYAICVAQGGGMRGCVAAGMASCLHCLGLADSFDGVYGASAGSLVGERSYGGDVGAVYI